MDAPWVPPGSYTVRLSGAGKHVEQPLTLRIDPRVTTSACAFAQLSALSKEMYDNAVNARRAYLRAREIREHLESAKSESAEALAKRVDALAPEQERVSAKRHAAVARRARSRRASRVQATIS